jgi:hypothetical protein
MAEIRGVETGGVSDRNQENLVPHVQRSKGMEARYANKCCKLLLNNERLRYA